MTITLYQEQLKHTLRQILHRTGENVNDGDLRAVVQMDESASDDEMLQRLIQTGIAKLKHLLRNHLTGDTDGSDVLKDPESWLFALDLNGDGQALADTMHWYVVWLALRNILPTLGLSSLAGDAGGEIKDAEALIKDALMELAMPIKYRRPVERPEDYAPIISLD